MRMEGDLWLHTGIWMHQGKEMTFSLEFTLSKHLIKNYRVETQYMENVKYINSCIPEPDSFILCSMYIVIDCFYVSFKIWLSFSTTSLTTGLSSVSPPFFWHSSSRLCNRSTAYNCLVHLQSSSVHHYFFHFHHEEALLVIYLLNSCHIQDLQWNCYSCNL